MPDEQKPGSSETLRKAATKDAEQPGEVEPSQKPAGGTDPATPRGDR